MLYLPNSYLPTTDLLVTYFDLLQLTAIDLKRILSTYLILELDIVVP